MFAIHVKADRAGDGPGHHSVSSRYPFDGPDAHTVEGLIEPGHGGGEGSSASNGLSAVVGMMRIPPPAAGTTRIVPREIPRRMMAWTSGRWALAWRVSHQEPADSGLIASTLPSTRG